MIRIFTVLFFSLLVGVSLRGDGVYVGVVDFQSKGVSPRNAKILTERFRIELNKPGFFTEIG